MNKNILYQASDKQEALDIISVLQVPMSEIKVAQDLPRLCSDIATENYMLESEALKIVFLSRISREKNLKYAIEILQRVNVAVSFDIYGPIEDKVYWEECKVLIKKMPAQVYIKYCGPVKPEIVNQVMQRYDLFFLPTFAESYGHVIVDALLAGLPVLISNGTPWKSLSEKKLGWDIDLKNPNGFIKTIEQFSYIDAQQRFKDKLHRKTAFANHLESSNLIQENIDLYRNIL